MRKFFTKLFVFSVPLIAALVIIDYKIAGLPHDFIYKKQYLAPKEREIEVLTLGTSHMFQGIDPKYISHKAYSLAYFRQPIYYDIRVAKQHIDKMPKLKLVIMGMEYFSLDYQMKSYDVLNYYYYHLCNIEYKPIPWWDVRRYSYLSVHTPAWTINKIKHGFDTTGDKFIDSNGFLGNPAAESLPKTDASGKKVVKMHTETIMADGEREYICNDLENFIGYLQSKNIQVVLVTAPVYHTYSDNVDQQKLKGNTELINKICSKHDIRYYNYFTDSRFGAGDFYDDDHLNTIGAEKYTRIVDSEIVKPLLH